MRIASRQTTTIVVALGVVGIELVGSELVEGGYSIYAKEDPPVVCTLRPVAEAGREGNILRMGDFTEAQTLVRPVDSVVVKCVYHTRRHRESVLEGANLHREVQGESRSKTYGWLNVDIPQC